MPRLIHTTPKYRKHRASGQAVVSIGGREIYLGLHGTAASRAEYDRVINEWLSNGRTGTAGCSLSVAEVVLKFWEHAKVHYRMPDGEPSGELDNFKYAVKPLVRLYGKTPASDFGPLALEAVRNVMIEQGWARKVINRQVGRVRAVFSWAVSRQLVRTEIHIALQTLKPLQRGRSAARETDKIKPVADSIVNATLPHLTATVRAMVQFQRFTGCRGGELCNMTTADIDTSKAIWLYRPPHHKTAHFDRDRVIAIGPKGQEVIRPLLKPLNPTAYIFSPADSTAEMRDRRGASRNTPLSCGNKTGTNRRKKPAREPGKKYNSHSYHRAVMRACALAFPVPADMKADAAAVQKWKKEHYWHPHRLRHSSATTIRKQFGLDAVAATLGQSTMAMAAHYAELDEQAAKDVASKIG